jgi:hypothetical protein
VPKPSWLFKDFLFVVTNRRQLRLLGGDTTMMILSKEQMDVIGRERGIHPRYRKEFLKLANDGRLDNREFGDRLHACKNYRAACADVMRVTGPNPTVKK